MENILSRTSKYAASAYNWCCNDLRRFVTYFDAPEPNRIVLYKHVWRMFSIPYGESDSKGLGVSIDYCPFCGTRLPRSLEDEWDTHLEDEHGLVWDENKEYFDDFLKRVPDEFRSDEWWKKRGL